MAEIDFDSSSLREINNKLQLSDDKKKWLIKNPGGTHALAVGLDKRLYININGSVGLVNKNMKGNHNVGCKQSQCERS